MLSTGHVEITCLMHGDTTSTPSANAWYVDTIISASKYVDCSSFGILVWYLDTTLLETFFLSSSYILSTISIRLVSTNILYGLPLSLLRFSSDLMISLIIFSTWVSTLPLEIAYLVYIKWSQWYLFLLSGLVILIISSSVGNELYSYCTHVICFKSFIVSKSYRITVASLNAVKNIFLTLGLAWL